MTAMNNVTNDTLKNLILSKFHVSHDADVAVMLETAHHKNGGYGKAEANYTYFYSYIVHVRVQREGKNVTKMSFEFSSLEDLLVWITE